MIFEHKMRSLMINRNGFRFQRLNLSDHKRKDIRAALLKRLINILIVPCKACMKLIFPMLINGVF